MATHLKRSLGLLEATLYGVGVIVGAGVYALIGKAAGLAGNAVWLSFIFGAFIAAFTGLSYAELASMFPKTGGEYVYAEKAFNRRLAFLVGWLVVVGGVIAAATISLGFAGYFATLFKTPMIPIAIALVALLSLINFWGIKESAVANIIATVVEVGGLIAIIVFGMKYVGSINYFEFSHLGLPGVLSGAALIFFAFLGFEDIVRLSGETKNPTKLIPRALILSIIISTILYVAVSVIAVSVVGWQALSASSAPLALVAQTALGQKAFFALSVVALFATFNTVLVTLVATSRMMYGMAEDNGLPKIFLGVTKKFRTPWFAILLTAIFSALFVLIGKIEVVASITDLALFSTFAIVNLALIFLRYRAPNMKRYFKVPINVGKFPVLAAIGAVSSVFMLFQFETKLILVGVALILAGLAIYELLLKKR